MPKNEPDLSDPMELVGVGCELVDGSSIYLAQCIAEEFLSMGHGVETVMRIFRSPEYALAHRAWNDLGDVRVFVLVSELMQKRSRPIQGGIHA